VLHNEIVTSQLLIKVRVETSVVSAAMYWLYTTALEVADEADPDEVEQKDFWVNCPLEQQYWSSL